ncbi:glycosyltransferase family 20 protein [Amanita muscaria Koide BX008]|uniref:Glycosyltransferase family 20 protein n=1 Tax=Amanita muscaria (strain Koide BX008) TaxID=946122 RepID=A0A0C2X1D6_AMAMK|nr:glycosyltransferase family 20 protein [Amanita muscaria Koide BX008]
MSSFRNHRVIVASLFLPTTAVRHGDVFIQESQPDPVSISNAVAAAALTAGDADPGNKSKLGQLRSIVDDLKDKVYPGTPRPRTPTAEIANPFAKILRFSDDVVVRKPVETKDFRLEITQDTTTALRAGHDDTDSPVQIELNEISPSSSRKHITTHSKHQLSGPRVKRKHSRSATRRNAESDISAVPLSRATSSSPTLGFATPDSQWHFVDNPHSNGGLKNAIQSVQKLKNLLWVGTLGANTDNFSEALRKDIDVKMMDEKTSLPVWIPDDEFAKFYDQFCHQVLWPCLHYAVPDAPKTKLFYESASWKQYVAVNRRFADTIMDHIQEGDMVWVNDYHLMLLPALIRNHPKYSSTNPIGFFMHVAFPSSEIFRCLSVRESLLNGILGADLVGFQTANYARHFRQTVSRILSYEALPKGIQIVVDDHADSGTSGGHGHHLGTQHHQHAFGRNDIELSQFRNGKTGAVSGVGSATLGRFVDVGIFPMGIDVLRLKKKKENPEVSEWVQVLKQRYAGMKMIVGRDKLDEIQGVRHKIQAFETFLDKHPEFQGKVVLIQVALQTTETNELHGGVADVVSRINSRYSTLTYQPVIFLHTQDLTFSQYLALLTVADAFIVTSLREGMALRSHEYVECQEGSYHPLILSEFTGTYSYSGFRSCIAINPYDKRGTADAIHQALVMPHEEQKTRWEELHSHVITQTAQTFVTTFLTRFIRAHTEHSLHDLSEIPVLDMTRVLPRWKHSQRRLLLVDFEGTLWKRDLTKEGLSKVMRGEAQFPEDALDLLTKLAENKNNEVWLLSGLQIKGVLDRVAEKVPKLGIVAENGCYVKARSSGRTSEWINMIPNLDLSWKSACLEMLHYFTERTPGSFVEEREASVVWRYWTGETGDSADRHWARRQAAEAQNHIFDSLGERFGLRIIPGKNSFLVLPNNVSRSTAVGAILHPGGPARSPLSSNMARTSWLGTSEFGEGTTVGEDLDLLVALSSDEKLLRRLNEFDNSETCSTSGKGTDAKWKLDALEVKSVLESLVRA